MGVILEKKMASGMSKILFFLVFVWIQWNPQFCFYLPPEKKVSFVEQ